MIKPRFCDSIANRLYKHLELVGLMGCFVQCYCLQGAPVFLPFSFIPNHVSPFHKCNCGIFWTWKISKLFQAPDNEKVNLHLVERFFFSCSYLPGSSEMGLQYWNFLILQWCCNFPFCSFKHWGYISIIMHF